MQISILCRASPVWCLAVPHFGKICGDYEGVLYMCICDAWRCHNLENIVETWDEFCPFEVWCLDVLQFGKNFGHQELILETFDSGSLRYIAYNLIRQCISRV
jgi:hypothetical protein